MLGFVICGTEHSGTTLCSDLFRQAPGIDAGFELGVLLAETPRHFPRVESHFQYLAPGWGATEAEVAALCATDDFAAFYRGLLPCARYLKPGTSMIFDKTPRYLAHLDACLARVSVPFIVTYKDPRATVHSDHLRAGSPDFDEWYAGYWRAKHAYLASAYAQFERHRASPRVFTLALETLCLATGASCEAMFAHAGVTFDPAYLVLRDKRYPNTRENSVSAGIPFAWRHDMAPEAARRVREDFASLESWFFPNAAGISRGPGAQK